MIDVEGLVLERPWGRVLDAIGFVARTGVATALVGPPGAGKTALLRCLATLDEPQAGRIRLAGVDPAREPAVAHARLGYVAQRFGLYDRLSVRRCIEHAGRMRVLTVAEAARAAETAAARFGLTAALGEPAGLLSDSGRLRLALAQASVHGPRVLLLDEPTADLGPFERADIAAHVRELAAGGATVLIAASELSELAGCCADLLELEEGRVVGEGVRRNGARDLAVADPAPVSQAPPGVNPELRRNLWLGATPRKLALAGAILAGLFVAVWLVDRGRHAYAITLAGAAVFLAAALLWAPGAARRAVTDEVRAETWDAQRLCALSPVAMAWGKLAGATATSWAFAGGGLLIAALQLASTSSLRHALAWVLAALGLAVTVQASGLASGLIDVRRARATGRRPSLRAPGLAVLVLGVLGLALLVWARSRFDTMIARVPLIGQAMPASAEVAWYGVRVSPVRFAAASLFVSALWALAWAWRLMRQELMHRNAPWPWLVFVASVWLYAFGFAPAASADDPLAARLALAAAASAALAYLAAFIEPADRVRARQFGRRLGAGDLGRALSHLPLVVAPAVAAALACALGVLIRLKADEGVLAVAALAAFAAFLRDLGLIAWRRFSGRGGDAGPILILVALYGLAAVVGLFAPHGRLVALLTASAARPRFSLVMLGLEAAAAWALAGAVVARRTPPPFRLTPLDPEPPPAEPTAVSPEEVAMDAG